MNIGVSVISYKQTDGFWSSIISYRATRGTYGQFSDYVYTGKSGGNGRKKSSASCGSYASDEFNEWDLFAKKAQSIATILINIVSFRFDYTVVRRANIFRGIRTVLPAESLTFFHGLTRWPFDRNGLISLLGGREEAAGFISLTADRINRNFRARSPREDTRARAFSHPRCRGSGNLIEYIGVNGGDKLGKATRGRGVEFPLNSWPDADTYDEVCNRATRRFTFELSAGPGSAFRFYKLIPFKRWKRVARHEY